VHPDKFTLGAYEFVGKYLGSPFRLGCTYKKSQLFGFSDFALDIDTLGT